MLPELAEAIRRTVRAEMEGYLQNIRAMVRDEVVRVLSGAPPESRPVMHRREMRVSAEPVEALAPVRQPETSQGPKKRGRPPGSVAKPKVDGAAFVGRQVVFNVGRASFVGEAVEVIPENGKLLIHYVNKKNQAQSTERDPALVRLAQQG